ncbi:MAG: 50S ribosomal protein L1 [Candidatus Parcubacteria bacterium]|nr:MAG: 50S ribosomal protein L1 [Candidatus Parcubacteria bacterium]
MKKEEKVEEKVAAPKKAAPKKISAKAKKKDWSAIYDANKSYSLNEALEILKKITTTKFDSSVEAHFRLGINPKKGDQQVRSAVSLPHGTGKTVRIAAFVSPANEKTAKDAGADLVGGEELIEQIKKSEKTDFEVAVAEPAIMRQLAVIAKILGTRGLMPSPKNETVTTDIAKAITELKKGKVSYKNDETANIHCLIGKMSFTPEQLADNYKALLDNLRKSKPSSAKGSYIKSAFICSSMSPSIKITVA